jgi:asparagine synthase (glutamine-hydrolysing)
MAKFLHIQQFNAALNYPDLQPVLRQLGYTMLGNGQSFQQFGQKAKKIDEAKESWLLDIYPENAFKNFENLAELDAEFSGLYFHKMKFSVDLFRDVFGAKSLFYYFENDLLIASNELRAILASLSKIPDIDLNAISDYFTPAVDDDFVNNSTFFSTIKKVLPGEILHFRAGKVESDFYWKPKFKSSLEPITVFSDRLKASVFAKINHQKSLAANLSGGLDSSSICAITSSFSKVTFKGIFFDTGGQASFEKVFAEEVALKGNFELDVVHPVEEPYTSIRKITRLTCKPECMVIPSTIFLPIMQKAAQFGSKVLLSGHGGDSTVGYGFEYIHQLVSAFKVKKAKEVLLKKWLLLNEDEAEPFEKYFIQQIIAHGKVSKPKLIAFLFLSGATARQYVFRKMTKVLKTKNHLPNILNKVPIPQNRQNTLAQWYQNFSTKHQFQYLKASLLNLSVNSMETMDALAREHGLVSSYPFFDKDLVTIAATVPSETNYSNGYLRGTLRNGMKGILPEKVRLRTKKAAFNDFGLQSFLKLESECNALFGPEHLVWTYVNKESYDLHLSAIKSGNNQHIWLCSRVLYLAIWLDEFYTS